MVNMVGAARISVKRTPFNGFTWFSVLALVLGLIILSACGNGMPSGVTTSNIGKLRVTSEGVAMTVAALWAAPRTDGGYDGGIEPTEVVVSTSKAHLGYHVDLSSIEAKGAGPSWEAATTSAAAFATLFSGTDPSHLKLDFNITGPIDGPSAGGLLTCALLAAYSGVSLKPDVTMTGTITPDGSIGLVGYVPRKIQAAADAGYRTVVIPAEVLRGNDKVSDGRTLNEYAESLGVALVPVRTVGEAFAALTGLASFYPVAEPPVLSARTQSSAAAVARNAVQRLRAKAGVSSSGVDAYTRGVAKRALTAAEADLASGNTAGAYGQGIFGAYRLVRAVGAARIDRVINGKGMKAARLVLSAEAQDVIRLARTEISRLRNIVPTTIEIQTSVPMLLNFPIYAAVAAEGVLAQLDAADDAETLIEMARVVAEERLAVVEALPDAEAIARSGGASPPAANAAPKFRAYEQLLNQAAQANERYADDVLGRQVKVDMRFTDQGLTAAISALRAIRASRSKNPNDTFSDAATGVAISMTDFWLTSALVTSAQAYGQDERSAVDTRRAFAAEAQDSAVTGASGTVFSLAAELADMGIRSELANWSTQWSTSVSDYYRGTPEETEAAWLAQSELWYDVIQVVMLRSMVAD